MKQANLFIDVEKSAEMAKCVVNSYKHVEVKDTATFLNGLIVGIVAVVRMMQGYAVGEDAFEKAILSWLANCDETSGLHFSRYIYLPKAKKDVMVTETGTVN